MSSSSCEVTGASAALASEDSNLSLEVDRLRLRHRLDPPPPEAAAAAEDGLLLLQQLLLLLLVARPADGVCRAHVAAFLVGVAADLLLAAPLEAEDTLRALAGYCCCCWGRMGWWWWWYPSRVLPAECLLRPDG